MSIRKTPTGRYEVRWREAGRRHGRTFDRLGDARVFGTEIRRRRQLGGLLSADMDITLEHLAAEWWLLHVEPNLAASTQLHYARVRDLHLLPHLGQYKLRELSPRLVNRFRADLLRNDVGAPTVRKRLRCCSRCSRSRCRRSASTRIPSRRFASRAGCPAVSSSHCRHS